LAGHVSTANLANLVSTANLANLVSTANLANHISTANLATLVSTSYLETQLGSTVIGLGTAGYISSIPSLSGLVSTANLANLISTANLAGHVSTANLANLVSTANLANHISTANLANLVSTSYLGTQLASTVMGLGTAGYVSSSQLTSTTTGTFSYISSFVSTFVQTTPGSYSGEQLYMNYSIPIGANYQLGINNIFGGPGTQFTSTITRNTTNNQLQGFITDFSLPSFFTTGLWTVTIFAESDDTGLTMYASLFLRSSLGVLTKISDSSQSPFIVAGTKISLDLVIDVPYTSIASGDTIFIRLFCANTTNSKDILLTLYFEDGNYSHVHTTLGTIVPQPLITSSLVGLGTMGYLSTIPWNSVVSTANLAHLVSTANLADLISTANLFDLVSTANLADLVSTSYLLNGIEFSSLSNESARLNFSSIFVNNVPILFDQYGNLSLSFQTL
jgi:hypothetical protein